jgi:hypothetical protein
VRQLRSAHGVGTMAVEERPSVTQQRSRNQRDVAEQAGVHGMSWLKTILELEHHSSAELARPP